VSIVAREEEKPCQQNRERYLLRPIAHERHCGPAVWIDAVVLRSIAISWDDIIIPGSWTNYGHGDGKPDAWFTNDCGLPRVSCCFG